MNTGTLTVKATLKAPEVGGTFTISAFGKLEITEVSVSDQGVPFYDVKIKTID